VLATERKVHCQPNHSEGWHTYPIFTRYRQESLATQEQKGLNDLDGQEASGELLARVHPLHTFDEKGHRLTSKPKGPHFVPRWQTSPLIATGMVNENLLDDVELASLVETCIETRSAVLGGFHFAPRGTTSDVSRATAIFAELASIAAGKEEEYLGDPMSHMMIPIFQSHNDTDRGDVVAVLQATIHWLDYLNGVLPEGEAGYQVVVEHSCDPSGVKAYTFEINGLRGFVKGRGDRHDDVPSHERLVVKGSFSKENIPDGVSDGLPFNQDSSCPYVFRVYPSQDLHDTFMSATPVLVTCAVAAIFLFSICMFLFFDRLVERRQKIILAKATQSTAIVSSLFVSIADWIAYSCATISSDRCGLCFACFFQPKQVRDRLLASQTEKLNRQKRDAMLTTTHRLKSFLNGVQQDDYQDEQPIADLFPDCTVMFADIAGFTAWSSAREPSQVFILLQTVYQNFDAIAKRRGVFKVETIGDSYVAVTGLPEPQPKHASIMARFAWDCLIRMSEVTKGLEGSLGPETGTLSMRFGLNSGSVTAGVLKGDRARFQLFGDTVNTASRMESTGVKGRIHVSSTTADALKKENKGSWLTPRSDSVSAKGKGVMSTFWVALKNPGVSQRGYGSDDDASAAALDDQARIDGQISVEKEARLVGWMSEMLVRQIKKVLVVRLRSPLPGVAADGDLVVYPEEGRISLDEFQEAISTVDFNPDVTDAVLNYDQVEIPEAMHHDVREYISMIASSYRHNKFHNFEHACHVTMSVSKLLSRVVNPDLLSSSSNGDLKGPGAMAAEIHNFTHGLISDPLATLALVFVALIHDVNHRGISNLQLAKEEPELAEHYRNKCLAEQNSLDIAWEIFMTARFKKLREYIFETQDELLRFRQLVVNMVLATDIFDKEFNRLRKDRWHRAFHEDLPDSVSKDLRATIIMEHIIQASDVSHTMQHWHVYLKWNRRLFLEMFAAHRSGRLVTDPRRFWFQGELDFFDNYVIPLAKKLKECHVFGVSSDEYLSYAMKNREEWAERGKSIVASMILDAQNI